MVKQVATRQAALDKREHDTRLKQIESEAKLTADGRKESLQKDKNFLSAWEKVAGSPNDMNSIPPGGTSWAQRRFAEINRLNPKAVSVPEAVGVLSGPARRVMGVDAALTKVLEADGSAFDAAPTQDQINRALAMSKESEDRADQLLAQVLGVQQ